MWGFIENLWCHIAMDDIDETSLRHYSPNFEYLEERYLNRLAAYDHFRKSIGKGGFTPLPQTIHILRQHALDAHDMLESLGKVRIDHRRLGFDFAFKMEEHGVPAMHTAYPKMKRESSDGRDILHHLIRYKKLRGRYMHNMRPGSSEAEKLAGHTNALNMAHAIESIHALRSKKQRNVIDRLREHAKSVARRHIDPATQDEAYKGFDAALLATGNRGPQPMDVIHQNLDDAREFTEED